MEKLLTQVCLSGSGYMKQWWNSSYCELEVEFVPQGHVYLPYNCDNFYKAERITHIIKLDRDQFHRKLRKMVFM